MKLITIKGKALVITVTMAALIVLTLVPMLFVPVASAAGRCVAGSSYGDAGTAHNYVKFQVNFKARNWHIEREWWAFFPADLWAYPDGNGVAKAGINLTDWNPPYSPSGYKICGTN